MKMRLKKPTYIPLVAITRRAAGTVKKKIITTMKRNDDDDNSNNGDVDASPRRGATTK